MSNVPHVVIFSHGFGVSRDDRGLFSDIVIYLPGIEAVLFDYNQLDPDANTLTVVPLDQQASQLAAIRADIRTRWPEAVVDLVCHSQGCIVAGLAELAGIRRTILLTPPADISLERMQSVFNHPGTTYDLSGDSHLARRDGSTTIVPASYWPSIANLDPIALYNQLSSSTDVTVVTATADEVLGSVDLEGLNPNITIIPLEADHDFHPPMRAQLTALVAKLLDAKLEAHELSRRTYVCRRR